MIEIISAFFVFCLVLFIYLHVNFHFKTGNELEMFEVDDASKERIEEIFDVRQPVLFDFDNKKIMETASKDFITSNYQAFDIKIRNLADNVSETEMYMPLPLHAANKLFKEDKNATFLSENNTEFLQETGVVKSLQYNDEFLRPYMVSNCNYDLLMGSEGTFTPFRYEINYRNFFLLTQGSAQIKLTPPQSTRYLSPIYDYENFEFSTKMNPWNPQPNFRADFDKIKCLEFTLVPGKTIYIPAYWWYSIKLSKETSIACFRYRTYMNNVAISPYIAMYALQIQNVQRNTTKKMNVSELNKLVPLKQEIIQTQTTMESSKTNEREETEI